MKVFQIMLGVIQPLLFRLFPFLTYKGVINTQISIYNRLKKRASEKPENELLNRLIISRIEAPSRVVPREEEIAYYRPLLENPNKTLEHVILAVIEYEYIESRREYIFKRLSRMGIDPIEALGEIDSFKARVVRDIKESIDKRVKRKNQKS